MPKLKSVPAPAGAAEVDEKAADFDGHLTVGPSSTDPEPEGQKKATKTATKATPTPKPSLAERGAVLSDADDFVSQLYMGPQKSGKTTCAAAMANLGRIAYINAEGGLKRRPLEHLGINTGNIVVFPRENEDLTYQYLEDLYWDLKGELQADPTSWAGTVWDSITEIHKELLHRIRDYMNAKALRNGKSRTKDAEPGDLYDSMFTDISDYGIMTDQMRLLLRRYKDLPCHFAVTALHKRTKDDDGHVLYSPYVTEKLGEDLMGYVDIIGVTELIDIGGEECYRALYRPLGTKRGGDRFHALPRYLYDPTFERVVGYVKEELHVDDDPVMNQIAELASSAGMLAQQPTPVDNADEDSDPETPEE